MKDEKLSLPEIFQALREVFGIEEARAIVIDSYDPILSAFFNQPVLDIIKFDRAIKTPYEMSLKENLKRLCKDQDHNYDVILKALLVTQKG